METVDTARNGLKPSMQLNSTRWAVRVYRSGLKVSAGEEHELQARNEQMCTKYKPADICYTVIQLLSPKNREPLAKLHYPEADTLIVTLLNTTKKDGFVNVYSPLELTSLNVIFTTCFGKKRFASTDDPFYKELTEVMRETMRRGSPTEEMDNFLPVLSVVDTLSRKWQDTRKFINGKRNPLFAKLINEVIESKVDCFTKSLLELEDVNDFDNLLATLCK